MKQNLSLQEYDILQSKTFNWLRFPLIFFILFLHSFHLDEDASSLLILNIGYIVKLIARLGVPFFFILSGYYFFCSKGESHFTKKTYLEKLWKRVSTLLIPYFVWNFLCYLYYLLIPYIWPADKSMFGFKDFIMSFIFQDDFTPADYPLWYMRDLMVLCFFSPIIYWMIRYLKFFTIVLCSLPYILNLKLGTPQDYLPQQSIFFFPLGAYFAIESKNIVYYCRKVKVALPLFLVVLVADVLIKNTYIDRVTIIIGLVALFNLVSYFIENNKLKENLFLSNASFFIFAFHGIPLMILVSRMYAILPKADWAYTLIFFSSVIIVAMLGLGLYAFLKKFFPRFTSVITGGR